MTSQSTPTTLTRGLLPTKLGLLHYTSTLGQDNTKLPLIGFHMSPRSVDEYKEIQQLNGPDRLLIAIDEFGYGCSDNPHQSCTLHDIADCYVEVLDRLSISKCIVAGSLMGCYLALSLAARYPDRVAGVVCSNLYYFTTAARDKALQEETERQQQQQQSGEPTTTPIVDSWILQDDGSHISEIWGKRSSWLSPDLNTRATWDNLNYAVKRRERYQQGIHIQDGAAFPLKETCAMIQCPVLCINGAGAVSFFDLIGMEMTKQFEEAMTFFSNQPEHVVLDPPGASINMLNENAKEWLERVEEFATRLDGD